MLTLLYCLEYWVPKQEDLRVLQTIKMKLVQAVQECSTLGRECNYDIQAALEVKELAITKCVIKKLTG